MCVCVFWCVFWSGAVNGKRRGVEAYRWSCSRLHTVQQEVSCVIMFCVLFWSNGVRCEERANSVVAVWCLFTRAENARCKTRDLICELRGEQGLEVTLVYLRTTICVSNLLPRLGTEMHLLRAVLSA